MLCKYSAPSCPEPHQAFLSCLACEQVVEVREPARVQQSMPALSVQPQRKNSERKAVPTYKVSNVQLSIRIHFSFFLQSAVSCLEEKQSTVPTPDDVKRAQVAIDSL